MYDLKLCNVVISAQEMFTGAIEINIDRMEVQNDVPEDLPFLPSSKKLNVRFIYASVVCVQTFKPWLSLSLSLTPYFSMHRLLKNLFFVRSS